MHDTKRWASAAALGALLLLAAPAQAQRRDLRDLPNLVGPLAGNIEHCTDQIIARQFLPIFDCGDELFEVEFNAADGVGGDVGNGQRFTRVPRYDLRGYQIGPVPRVGGPNAQSCVECHPGAPLGGGGDGAGKAALNNVQDRVGARGRGDPAGFVVRNPPHLFAPGALQVLAEEMTLELAQQRTQAIAAACQARSAQSVPLTAKGVSFGMLRVTPRGGDDCLTRAQLDTRMVQGIDPDLVVRPFGLEGSFASLRSFVLAAFHNELGMEPVEFAGMGNDNDRDGVANEIFVDDVTAMTVYLAAQPRPVTELELDDFRRALQGSAAGRALAARLPLPTLSAEDRQQIGRGQATAVEIGCTVCHVPAFTLAQGSFAEPSPLAAFRQPADRSPAGIDLRANRVDPANPLRFDLVTDPPDNRFAVGDQRFNLGGLQRNAQGQPVLQIFSDLKRHDMGADNAEEVERRSEVNAVIPGSVFITAELWGVGSTAPYLHDGSATTLAEAVLSGHGGEAAASRAAFQALPPARAADLIRFLNNLVLFFPVLDEDEDTE